MFLCTVPVLTFQEHIRYAGNWRSSRTIAERSTYVLSNSPANGKSSHPISKPTPPQILGCHPSYDVHPCCSPSRKQPPQHRRVDDIATEQTQHLPRDPQVSPSLPWTMRSRLRKKLKTCIASPCIARIRSRRPREVGVGVVAAVERKAGHSGE